MWPAWPALAVVWAIPASASAKQQLCPAPCSTDPGNWTPYSSLDGLSSCNHPVLLDFSSHKSLDSPDAAFKVLACTLDDNPEISSTELTDSLSLAKSTESVVLTPESDIDSAEIHELNLLLDHVQIYLTQTPDRDTHSLLWQLNTTSLGIFSGVSIDNALTASVIQGFRNRRTRRGATVQLCGGNRDVDHTFGMRVDISGSLEPVQTAVDSWAKAQCVGSSEIMQDMAVVDHPVHGDGETGWLEYFACKSQAVGPGDTCLTMAERCGLSAAEFMKYNLVDDLCELLQPGSRVCCSESDLPGESEDGTCAIHTTKANETCASIAAAFSLEDSDISSFNDEKTWGWSGCDLIQPGLRICLSEGKPPLPAPVTGAVCGPIVPGTEAPPDGVHLAELNPCPLHACCNTLGICGVSPEFCIYKRGLTGNPGTAPPGLKGCVSNCGMEILDNSDEPEEFMRIGYYESFNFDRPCLNLRAANIDVDEYTHVHWGFATINSTFHIGVNDTFGQWEDFLALEGVNRIVSFGGWGYSINSANYDVLREAMAPENVDTFIVNIMSFIVENGLDGVDFDWEYPGASDVPSLSLGLLSDGPNYLAFLRKLKKIFPRDKSISMAAPASYWYLRVFPIEEMWYHLDYIVYMTYDLHGQWDYDNPLAQDWCEKGNCLRSHVNLTETRYSLAMITKAGVPRNMIAVGVASYGRAFGMTKAGCTWPECTFVGPTTAATPGICTRTPGVLANAEIEELIIEGDINESYYDVGSDSNILVYNDTQWVAYMGKYTTKRRIEYYKRLKFGGYANWAVDLTAWSGDDGDPDGDEDEEY
ncbi:glycoside hydrolase superfamily [Aspergillus californicus]